MKGMKPDLLLPFMSLSFSLLLHSDLYGQAKEYTPQHPMSADAIPKADVITQVLPDRRRCPEVVAGRTRLILDGEIAALDEKGRSSFQLLYLFRNSGH